MIKMIANRHRGESIIEIDDKAFLLRGTFDALAKIEEIEPGRGVRKIILDMQADAVSLRDLVQMIHCAMVDPKLTVEELGETLMPLGYAEIATKLLPVLEFGYLGRSIGDYPPEEIPEKEITKEPEAYPFRQILGVATARLGWGEEQFWASTPQSFFAAIRELSGPSEGEKREQWKKDTAAIFDALGEKAA